MIIYENFQIELEMIERITAEEEKASEAIANLAGRNGINFRPLSPSSADIRTLEHEGLFYNVNFARKVQHIFGCGRIACSESMLFGRKIFDQSNSRELFKIADAIKKDASRTCIYKTKKVQHIFILSTFFNPFNVGCTKWDFSISFPAKTNRKNFNLREYIFFCHVTTT